MKNIKIGRDRSNDYVVSDPTVTRTMHCQLLVDDYGSVKIIDSSKNGTFVNGMRIGRGAQIPLNQTDIVRVGNTTLPWQTIVQSFGLDYSPINVPPADKPYNYLALSILSLILCSPGVLPLIFSIISLCNAVKVNPCWERGDYEEAYEAAGSAKAWFWWSFGLGLFGWICTIIVIILNLV